MIRPRRTPLVLSSLVVVFAGSAGEVAAIPGQHENLSQPGVSSYWAYVFFRSKVSAEPRPRAKTVGRVTTKTQDRTDELVTVLERTYDARDREWLRIRLPRRPNGGTGWIRRYKLGELHRVSTWLKIDRATRRAVLVKSGKEVFDARVGVGRPQTPTVAGEFYIRDRLKGFRKRPMYGPLAFGTNAYSKLSDWPRGGVIGIHGTDHPKPFLVPSRMGAFAYAMQTSKSLGN